MQIIVKGINTELINNVFLLLEELEEKEVIINFRGNVIDLEIDDELLVLYILKIIEVYFNGFYSQSSQEKP